MCGGGARKGGQGGVVVVTSVVHPALNRYTHRRTIRNTLIRGVRGGFWETMTTLLMKVALVAVSELQIIGF